MKIERRIEAVDPPPGWGSDPVSEFINLANQNTYATFVHNRDTYDRLGKINDIFREIDHLCEESSDILASFFIFRSHAAYLGAIRFSLSCQVPEAFLVMRGCLENALYGAYVHNDIQKQQLWIDRDIDAATRKKVRNEFQISKIFSFLEKQDPKTCAIARELYDSTIDYGAHPNRKAILGGVRRREEGQAVHLDMDVISGDNIYSQLGLKRNMQIGICSLMICRGLLDPHDDHHELADRIERLKEGL